MNIRVMVVDDHSLFRRGLTALLTHEAGLEVVGEAADGVEALRRVQELQPAVVLLDNHMPGVRGVDLLPGLLEVAPDTQFIMLTVSEDEDDLAAALRAGAAGYLLKTIDGQDLAAAIRRAVGGESVVSGEMTHKLVRAFKASSLAAAAAPPATPAGSAAAGNGAAGNGAAGNGAAGNGESGNTAADFSLLSPREQELLREIVRGASNKEIARTLGIAETTVKIHVQHILRKLNLSSRVQVAVWASERGLG